MRKQSEHTRVSFYTHGCRLNQAETALMEEDLIRNGYQIVAFGQEADICVINSCTVTENGDADTRKTVRRFLRKNPASTVAVVGCYSQVAADKVAQIPGVKYVIGNRVKMQLGEILNKTDNSQFPIIVKETLGKQESFSIASFNARQRTVRANLKIQDGCDFFCSFCVIPFARGRASSRNLDDILKEAHQLVENGHQELVITGINVGTFKNNGYNFLDVLKALEQINGLKQIRISSIEPTTINRDFLEYMASSPKLCNYLHLPLQSGSNAILQRMNRKYSAQQFLNDIETALQIIPDISIGTDIIVGFPGETENYFRETRKFVADIPFSYFHVFSYSDRSLAKASKFDNKVPPHLIRERSQILREMGKRKKELYYSKMIGKKLNVLFEQKKGDYWVGHDEHFILVKVKSKANLKNRFKPVRINEIVEQYAIGNLINEE